MGRAYFASPRARRKAEELGIDLATLVGTGPNHRIVEADVVEAAERLLAAARAVPAAPDLAARANPAVRQLAATLGVDLARVAGSGPGGRITERDVRAAAEATGGPRTEAARPAPAPAPAAVRALSRIRRLTAERMAQSARTVARVTLFRTVEMDEAVRLRRQLQPEFEAKGTKLSYDLLIARACALALREHPAVNARWVEGEGIAEQTQVNVGIAVALEPEGLVVPILKDADRRDLLTLARDLDGLVERARAGRLTPDDATGGTFTITNLGHYGVDRFTPIVNPPETAILGVGRLQSVPAVVDEGKIKPRQRLELALSFDHRVVDGAPAARYLARVAELLERPYRLLAEWT